MFSSQAWDSLPFHLRPKLKDVVRLLLTSRAESTVQKYLPEIKKFVKLSCDKQIVPSLPLSPAVIAVYLSELVTQQHRPASALAIVYAALKWFQTFVPIVGANPLDDACCKNIVESAKRARERPISKKEPVTTEIIKKVIDNFATPEASLKDLRVATFFSLGFAGFFRFNELSNIHCNHIVFSDEYVKIFIPRSKTDIYREGNYVYIAKTHTKYCPVSIIERYLTASETSPTSNLPLFRALRNTKSGSTLRNQKLSYSRCREIFKETLQRLGYDSSVYGLHSLRAGGVTSAVNNETETTISGRLLKLHGRWKTDIAKDMYVKESEHNRLSVSRTLGL